MSIHIWCYKVFFSSSSAVKEILATSGWALKHNVSEKRNPVFSFIHFSTHKKKEERLKVITAMTSSLVKKHSLFLNHHIVTNTEKMKNVIITHLHD